MSEAVARGFDLAQHTPKLARNRTAGLLGGYNEHRPPAFPEDRALNDQKNEAQFLRKLQAGAITRRPKSV